MKFFLFLSFFLLFSAWKIDTASAGESPVLRDFITTETLAPGDFEISADYLLMNEALDLFDLRESETTAQTLASSPALGDLQGGRVLVNLGLLPRTGLHLSYGRMDLEAGPVEFPIDSWELYLRRRLLDPIPGRNWSASLDVGGRHHRAGDRTLERAAEIDSFVRRIDPNLSIGETATHILISDGTFLLQALKEGRPPLAVSLEDLQDSTVFARLTLGRSFDAGALYLYSEAGRSEIDSEVDSNIDLFIPAGLRGEVEDFPIDLDRHELYWKVGSNLQLRLPLGAIGNLRYEYIRLDRDGGLDEVNYNHLVQGDLVFPVHEALALDIGATYMRRQFNGIIPFMYNRFTQSTFDHNYGFVHMGLTVRFP